MLLNLDQYIAENNNKKLEVTGGGDALNQCVDNANGYIRDVLGQKIIAHCNAQDFPNKVDKSIYDYILNTPSNEPISGDILIFKHKNGVGHISIFVKVINSNTVQSFDENWPVGAPCKLVNHSYNLGGYNRGQYEIVGWLRCKMKPVINSEPIMTDQETSILKFIRETQVKDRTTGLMRPVVEGDVREGIGYITDKIDEKVKSLETKIGELTSEVSILAGNATVDGKSALEWQTEAKTANEKLATLQNSTLQDKSDSEIFHEALDRFLLINSKK